MDRPPCAQGALASASALHLQLLFTVNPSQLLRVHLDPFALEQDMDPAITEASSLAGNLLHLVCQSRRKITRAMKHTNDADMKLSDTIKKSHDSDKRNCAIRFGFLAISSKLRVLHTPQKNRFQVGQISNRLIRKLPGAPPILLTPVPSLFPSGKVIRSCGVFQSIGRSRVSR